jgi:hypothetical protein
MSPIVVIECGAPQDHLARVFYRWSCAKCSSAGEWTRSLNEAETQGAAHNRFAHGQGEVVRA